MQEIETIENIEKQKRAKRKLYKEQKKIQNLKYGIIVKIMHPETQTKRKENWLSFEQCKKNLIQAIEKD